MKNSVRRGLFHPDDIKTIWARRRRGTSTILCSAARPRTEALPAHQLIHFDNQLRTRGFPGECTRWWFVRAPTRRRRRRARRSSRSMRRPTKRTMKTCSGRSMQPVSPHRRFCESNLRIVLICCLLIAMEQPLQTLQLNTRLSSQISMCAMHWERERSCAVSCTALMRSRQHA